MSRCYPFPPPGYAGKCSSHEALILSIKLQKERERAISDSGAEKLIPEKSNSSEKRKDKGDKKKEKKDKEDRRKEKKEKKRDKKAKAGALVDNGKQDDVGKLAKAGNVGFESKGKLLQGSSAELLERSSVTEEHVQPMDLQNASCSSDSTGNSGKRRRFASSPSGIQSNGNIIRIRLSSSQKRDEPSTAGSKEQEAGRVPQATSHSHALLGASLVKPDSSVKLKNVITTGLALLPTASTSTATLQLVPTVDSVSRLKEKTTEKEKLSSSEKSNSSQSLQKLSSRYKKMQKKESLYKNLFVDWVAHPLERTPVVDENDDEEWLFGKKGEDRSAKRLRMSEENQSLADNISCSASAVMQPCAQLLADVGVYALPFTVPF